jgi:hypothetical protein
MVKFPAKIKIIWQPSPRMSIMIYLILMLIFALLLSGCDLVDQLADLGDSVSDLIGEGIG